MFPTLINLLGVGEEVPWELPAQLPFGGVGETLRIGVACEGQSAAFDLPMGREGYSNAVSIASMPDPRSLCVVVYGATYVVGFDGTFTVADLETYSVNAVVPCPAAGVLALLDFVRVKALRSKSVEWVSEDVSDDEASYVRLSGETMVVKGYSAAKGTWQLIDVNLRTGDISIAGE